MKPAPSQLPAIHTRPLMSTSAVTWRLDCDQAQLAAMVEDGRLLWAFDISLRQGEQPGCLRVLTESVEEAAAGRQRTYRDEEAEWRRVVSLIFPSKVTIVTCELARALNCGRQQALDLIHGQNFQLVPGRRIRRGPGGSPLIQTASAAVWLRERRVL